MKTNDEILDQLTCCTIDGNADLDVKENFYYKYEDVIKAMNEARTQVNGAEQCTSNCIKPDVSNLVCDCTGCTEVHQINGKFICGTCNRPMVQIC